MNLPSRIGKLEQARSVEVCSQCGQSPGAYADVAAAVRDALADPHVVSCKPTSALQVTEMTGQSFWVSDVKPRLPKKRQDRRNLTHRRPCFLSKLVWRLRGGRDYTCEQPFRQP
jgi:hypothetical protein